MKFRVLLLMVVLVMLVLPGVAYASPLTQDPVSEIDLVIAGYVASFGLSFLTPFVIELLKRFKVIKDGMAGTWSVILNVVLFGALLVLNAFGVDLEGDMAQSVIEICASAAALVLMILNSFTTFKVMRANQVPLFRKRNGV